MAIHLSIMNLDMVTSQLLPLYGPDCPVVVVFRASWPDEMILRGTLCTIGKIVAKSGVDKNALILVGRSLSHPDFGESYLYSVSRQRDAKTQDGTESVAADREYHLRSER
jgi:precorrin-4/cobalt-precorrin-4 C11-methyltransferase